MTEAAGTRRRAPRYPRAVGVTSDGKYIALVIAVRARAGWASAKIPIPPAAG